MSKGTDAKESGFNSNRRAGNPRDETCWLATCNWFNDPSESEWPPKMLLGLRARLSGRKAGKVVWLARAVREKRSVAAGQSEWRVCVRSN